MYKRFLFLLLITNSSLALAQTFAGKDECSTCKLSCLCNDFFRSYLSRTDLIGKINENWNEFFGENLEQSFPAPKGVRSVSVKFDGLGCIYPNSLGGMEEIKADFLASDIINTRFYKSSFYSLFFKVTQQQSNDRIEAFINETGFDIRDFKDVPMQGKQHNSIEYFDFIKQWNERFLKEKIKEIDDVVSKNNIKRVIIYIHGYNVPYSLAQLQGNVLLDSILSFDPTIQPSELLFVRLFWPSGDNKRHELSTTACDYSNIENLKTVKSYLYYSNRAYLAGIYTRRILRLINTDIPIDIVTHSHGSTVATTSVINTSSKLQKGTLSDSIENLMNREEFPEKRISIFLNAPSIPGVQTFIDIDENKPVYSNYYFFIGYNRNDLTLKKQRLKVFGKTVRFISPAGKLSSTTLGCDRNNEVGRTLAIFAQKGLNERASAKINSTQEEHEFYCYLKQRQFKENLLWFFKR